MKIDPAEAVEDDFIFSYQSHEYVDNISDTEGGHGGEALRCKSACGLRLEINSHIVL